MSRTEQQMAEYRLELLRERNRIEMSRTEQQMAEYRLELLRERNRIEADIARTLERILMLAGRWEFTLQKIEHLRWKFGITKGDSP